MIEFSAFKNAYIGTNVAYSKVMLKIDEEKLLQKRRATPRSQITKRAINRNVNLHFMAMNIFLSFDKKRGRKGVKECVNY